MTDSPHALLAFVQPGGHREVPAAPIRGAAAVDAAAADLARIAKLFAPPPPVQPVIWYPGRRWMAWLRGGGR